MVWPAAVPPWHDYYIYYILETKTQGSGPSCESRISPNTGKHSCNRRWSWQSPRLVFSGWIIFLGETLWYLKRTSDFFTKQVSWCHMCPTPSCRSSSSILDGGPSASGPAFCFASCFQEFSSFTYFVFSCPFFIFLTVYFQYYFVLVSGAQHCG